MTAALLCFTVEREGKTTILSYESEDGETMEVSVTPRQLDRMGELVDQHLAFDETVAASTADGDEEAA